MWSDPHTTGSACPPSASRRSALSPSRVTTIRNFVSNLRSLRCIPYGSTTRIQGATTGPLPPLSHSRTILLCSCTHFDLYRKPRARPVRTRHCLSPRFLPVRHSSSDVSRLDVKLDRSRCSHPLHYSYSALRSTATRGAQAAADQSQHNESRVVRGVSRTGHCSFLGSFTIVSPHETTGIVTVAPRVAHTRASVAIPASLSQIRLVS